MVVDTSALVAILLKEPGYARLVAALRGGQPVRVSAATVAETAVVLERRAGSALVDLLYDLLAEAEAEIVPFTFADVSRVVAASATYGTLRVARAAREQFTSPRGSSRRRAPRRRARRRARRAARA